MGRPKQLETWQGQPLLRHVAATALEAQLGPVIVVLGAHADVVRPVIEDLACVIATCPQWQLGIGASIRPGVAAALAAPAVGGVILLLADQPQVTASRLIELAVCHRTSGRPIVAARYAGTAGVPAYFARPVSDALLALPVSEGCKAVIRRRPHEVALVDMAEAAFDVDTPDDLRRAEGETILSAQ